MSGRTIISILTGFIAIMSCNLHDHTQKKPSVSVRDLKNRSGSLILENAFPAVIDATRDSDSLFWLVYDVSSSTKEQSVMIASGKDDTWKDVLTIHPDKKSVSITHPGIWMDPDGKLWIFWTKQVNYSSGKIDEIWALTGDPVTDELIRSKPFFISDGILTGKPVLLSNGKFILSVGKDQHIFTIASFDHGKTWSVEGMIELTEKCEAVCTIIECQNGSLWMLIQTSGNIWESRSTDQGLNWSRLVASNITHAGHPFFVRKLISGNILLVKQAETLKAHISVDNGQTWLGELILDESAQVLHIAGHQVKDFFSPCCSEISIIYDIQQDNGNEIRTVSFREDDVMSGQKRQYLSPFR